MSTVGSKFQPADRIYTSSFWRPIMSPRCIFMGKFKVTNPNNQAQQEIDDAVIHFLEPGKKKYYSEPQCSRCFYMPGTRKEGIVINCLDCFGEGDSITVYDYDVSSWTMHLVQKNGTCSKLPSHPPDKVLPTAFAALEKKIDFGTYNLFFNNCEDFATFCKTGKARSNQMAEFFSLPGSIAYRIIEGIFFRK